MEVTAGEFCDRWDAADADAREGGWFGGGSGVAEKLSELLPSPEEAAKRLSAMQATEAAPTVPVVSQVGGSHKRKGKKKQTDSSPGSSEMGEQRGEIGIDEVIILLQGLILQERASNQQLVAITGAVTNLAKKMETLDSIVKAELGTISTALTSMSGRLTEVRQTLVKQGVIQTRQRPEEEITQGPSRAPAEALQLPPSRKEVVVPSVRSIPPQHNTASSTSKGSESSGLFPDAEPLTSTSSPSHDLGSPKTTTGVSTAPRKFRRAGGL